ncbi:MAG TPA: hypothetical protein VKY90_03170 [Candidatus Dormibacteraeota bacterium]|nr:hypothetical protein [Candidatus Dormibacteraeota bacterium]
MAESEDRNRAQPPALVRRWESLGVGTQMAIAGPVLVALMFLLNVGAFAQPLWRSVLYGLIEGGFFTALLLVATASERSRRDGGRRAGGGGAAGRE